MVEASDNERREGRIAFLCTLSAKALLVLGVIFGGWADDGTGAGEFEVGLALLPLLLVAVTSEVAGLVYGIGGRKTTFGRWGIGLSCLSLGVIVTLAYVLGHR